MNRVLCAEINNYLRKKARKFGIRAGERGIASYLQRAGSALNLNLHFHLLALDGIYAVDEGGDAIFHKVTGIHEHEVSRVLEGVSRRVIMHLRKSRKLSSEA
ncbi:MAG: transposase [Oligoflexus sp.]|nr:transposase [Oligoflexus sp.]